MSQVDTENYDQLLRESDVLIKSGKINLVVATISKINIAQVPRNYRQSLAKLCRRAGMINHGIRLLHPIIRHELQLIDPATPSEICEYAVLISRIGSINEALLLLKEINPSDNPESQLYSGFCHVSNWNYTEAQKYFENYLKLNIDDYSSLIAKVNLAACYIGSGLLDSAKILIEDCLHLAQKANSARLQGNCLELRGQLNVLSFNFVEAKNDLNLAREIFSNSRSYDALLTNKWQSIITAFETKSVEPLLFFRKSAEDQKHWESVRESDLFRVRIEFNQKIYDQLIFGTPSTAYQKRAYEILKCNPSDKLIWGDPDAKCIDLSTFNTVDTLTDKSGKKMHQMLQSLLNDLYAPRSVAALFSEIYADECFNIESSPYRIRQLVKRLRRWFEENSLNAQIKYESGAGYRLICNKGFSLLLSRDQNHSKISTDELYFQKLKLNYFKKGFRVTEACSLLNISESGFHRFIRHEIQKGNLIKLGKARSTLYVFAENKSDLKKTG